jgi:tRNA pseudouridine13 synthase
MSLPDWARAYGAPLFAARIRTTPEDFQVTEELGFEFAGDGEHDYLWIEKTGTNTEWLARQLAKFADVPARDIGYAGLKDRHAITRQWFSVPRWNSPEWAMMDIEGADLLDVRRHSKKLRRGAHKSNAFRLVMRGNQLEKHAEALAARIAAIRAQGVPNYFGEQRFGRDGANLGLADAWAKGKRLPRYKRSIAISTIRSFVFNELLDERVQSGTWNVLLAGDKANLDGTASVFDVDEVDEKLLQRCAAMDIHPAGELVGDGSDEGPAAWLAALGKARVDKGTRSLRLKVDDLAAQASGEAVTLSFTLGRGAFATSVLREIAQATSA